ncbi:MULTISPECIES: methyltransferase [Halorussus]|uniref:methyltransferase n=1 Tax=Halorussus TaxID=1070314 RepID=UPI000E2113DF|nr:MULTISPECIES: methyltransferase [Halorussus]NHN59253.1 methyltransferase [Halorussus sp. JP-T4]
MPDTTYDGTIDWNRYWTKSDDAAGDDANGSAEYVADALFEFIGETEVPDSHADVGCGGGALAFDVAARHPETTVVGYDAAESVLDANRERAREVGRENVAFERTVLPEFDPGRQFDLVTCFYTLCYVADTERALRNLYEAVAPGGSLVLTYHNRYARTIFEGIAEAPGEHLDESSAWSPERFADRFELVIEGESLLSYDRIRDALGAWPRSIWAVAEESDRYPAWRQNPLVYVPK